MEPQNGFLGKGRSSSTNPNRRRLFPDPARKLLLSFKLKINLPGNPSKNKHLEKIPGSLKENYSQIIFFIVQGCLLFFAAFVWLLEVSRPNVGAKRLARTCPQGPVSKGWG